MCATKATMWKDTCPWILVLTGITLLQGPSPTNAISARIHAVPMNISLNPGANLTLTCLVQHGGPADAIQWFKYDEPISIKQRSNPLQQKISLKNITRADAGKYKCTVWKGQQTDTDVFYLQVNGVPVITHLPKEVHAKQNEDKRIPCEAEGWPKPTIRWKRFDDSYLKDDMNYGIKPHPTLNRVTLLLRSANQDLEGEYYCEASNVFGKVQEDVWVTIETPPMRVFVKSHYVVARKGSNVTLVCEATSLYWQTSYWGWYFNNIPLPSDQNTVREVNGRMIIQLHIHNVSEGDEGLYKCEMLGDLTAVASNITLIVDEKENLQNISTSWKTVQATTDNPAQLKCLTSYSPFLEAETFWLFQGGALNNTDVHYETIAHQLNRSRTWRTVEMSLGIKNITDSDFGNYSCVINSSVGMSLEKILLVQKQKGIEFSMEGEAKNSTVLIILFPLLAGGLLLALTGLLFLRRLQRRRHDQKYEEAACDGEFKYDVFVTFSSKDRHWVSNKLTPLLESQQLKYCIHSRDFELGRALVDNMAESVYSSRKVLAVMSKNYMESKFCRGELEMALYRSKVGKDGSLLVVTIDEIKKKKLPKALRESTFVDYHSDKGSAWEKKLMRFLEQTEEKNPNIFNTKL